MRYALLTAVLVLPSLALALDGQIGIHDPSTIVRCNGKFYTYGTGGSSLVSDDGWTWSRGTALPRRGLAPDVIHIGDRYYVYVAANIGAQPKAAVNMIWNKTLDPASPDYKWEEGGVVASSDGVEDSNAIDPGVFLDPTDGRLWLVYGSYFGYTRLVELNSKTGTRLNSNDQPRDLAINCEASDMIYHDGWYYLPGRPDLQKVIEQQGKKDGRIGGQNAWPVDMLQPGDVYVCDHFGLKQDGPSIGDNVGNAIYARSHNGIVYDGAVRDRFEGTGRLRVLCSLLRSFAPLRQSRDRRAPEFHNGRHQHPDPHRQGDSHAG